MSLTEEQLLALTEDEIKALTPEQLQEVLAFWRRKCLLGEATREMTKTIVSVLRGNRTAALTAQTATARKRAAGSKKPKSAAAQAKLIDSDALLAQLD